jgi:hypothetical protein
VRVADLIDDEELRLTSWAGPRDPNRDIDYRKPTQASANRRLARFASSSKSVISARSVSHDFPLDPRHPCLVTIREVHSIRVASHIREIRAIRVSVMS